MTISHGVELTTKMTPLEGRFRPHLVRLLHGVTRFAKRSSETAH